MGVKWFGTLAVGALALVGCSFSIGDTPTNAAEDLIEGEPADFETGAFEVDVADVPRG